MIHYVVLTSTRDAQYMHILEIPGYSSIEPTTSCRRTTSLMRTGLDLLITGVFVNGFPRPR